MRSLSLVAALVLGAWTARASAQDLIRVEPDACAEGRPTQLRLTYQNTLETPIALSEAAAGIGAELTTLRWGQELRGVSLDPLSQELLTLELTAHEALGPAARAPRDPVQAMLAGPRHRLLRFLAPGETLVIPVRFVPGLEPPAYTCRWTLVALAPEQVARAPIYVHRSTEIIRPASPGVASRMGGELSAPLARRGGPRSADLELRLTRWVPWERQPVREVLIAAEALGSFQNMEVRTKIQGLRGPAGQPLLRVEPAAFSREAARQRAGLATCDAAVRLGDDRWILQSGEGYAVVGPEGSSHTGSGRLFPFAEDLALHGQAGFLWPGHREHPELSAALAEAGFAEGSGKAISVGVGLDDLVPFLELLARHGAWLSERGLEAPAR